MLIVQKYGGTSMGSVERIQNVARRVAKWHAAGHQVVVEARRRGVLVRPLGDIVVLMPRLAISSDELQRLVRVTAEAITVVTERLGVPASDRPLDGRRIPS